MITAVEIYEKLSQSDFHPAILDVVENADYPEGTYVELESDIAIADLTYLKEEIERAIRLIHHYAN